MSNKLLKVFIKQKNGKIWPVSHLGTAFDGRVYWRTNPTIDPKIERHLIKKSDVLFIQMSKLDSNRLGIYEEK